VFWSAEFLVRYKSIFVFVFVKKDVRNDIVVRGIIGFFYAILLFAFSNVRRHLAQDNTSNTIRNFCRIKWATTKHFELHNYFCRRPLEVWDFYVAFIIWVSLPSMDYNVLFYMLKMYVTSIATKLQKIITVHISYTQSNDNIMIIMQTT